MSNDILNLFNIYDVFYNTKYILKSILIVFSFLILYFVIRYCCTTIPNLLKKYKTTKKLKSNLYLGNNISENINEKNILKYLKLLLCFVYIILFTISSSYYLKSTIENNGFKDSSKFSSELNKLFVENNLSETETDLKTLLSLNETDAFIKYISINEIKENKDLKISLKIDYLLNNEYKSEDLELNLFLSEDINEVPIFSVTDVSFSLNDKDISILEKEVSSLKYKYLLNKIEKLKENSKYPENNFIINEDFLIKLIKEGKVELNY